MTPFLFLIFIIVLSCNNSPKQTNEKEKVYSKDQQELFDLLDNYKSEYFAAKHKDRKDSIQNKYSEKLQYFLMNSLGSYIDSMNVTVDTVIQEGWLVTTLFHSRDIEFKYGMEFKDSMDSKDDSYYRWMQSLKPKSNVTLNFALVGSWQLNYPDQISKSVLKIFALPEPLKGSLKY